MSARRPLQPLSPLSANVPAGAKQQTYPRVVAAHDDYAHADMFKQAQDDTTQGSGSIISGLTSLENDATDDFERLMIQNARDDRRFQAAVRGSVKPFRKARSHPNVALTLENLARNNARNGDGTAEPGAHVKFESPSDSSGSVRSDPAVRYPSQWGRKGRPRRDWLRTITVDEEPMSGAQEDTLHQLGEEETPRPAADARTPSIEDSPLSHKSLPRGTPLSLRSRRALYDADSDLDMDLTFDFNEASMIASTPYMPRNTKLDDIRQREIESLKEQGLATNRLDRLRETSPEEQRRPTTSPPKRMTPQQDIMRIATDEHKAQPESPTERRSPHRRANSWKTIGKSQPVTGETNEQSLESSVVITRATAGEHTAVETTNGSNTRQTPLKRPVHRKEDSQELLRRLARVSSQSPSPGRVSAPRPQTAPAQKSSPLTRMTSDTASRTEDNHISPTTEDTPLRNEPKSIPVIDRSPKRKAIDENQRPVAPLALRNQSTPDDVDRTPLPRETSALAAKTPVVTGAWIDTPAPRSRRTTAEEISIQPATKSRQSSPQKRSPQLQTASQVEEVQETVELTRPTLPGSALEAIVEEARARGKTSRHQDAYGDSTIDSLEDLIASRSTDSDGAEIDEDTLQGLQLPTNPPRNDRERARQQELRDLHSMNQRLRAARTGIRDANRGLQRIERNVEHVEENGQTPKSAYRECPCAAVGHHSGWTGLRTSFTSAFYDRTAPGRMGLTWFSIMIIGFLVWCFSESVACEFHCHKLYGHTMHGYGVDPDAPRFPFVLPILFYRKLVRFWFMPLWRLISWSWSYYWADDYSEVGPRESKTETVFRVATSIVRQAAETAEAVFEDFSMADDEVVYGR